MKKSTPATVTHKDHNTRKIEGSWGPHKAKILCVDCNDAFVCWTSSEEELYQKQYDYWQNKVDYAATFD